MKHMRGLQVADFVAANLRSSKTCALQGGAKQLLGLGERDRPFRRPFAAPCLERKRKLVMSIQAILDRKGAEVITILASATVRSAAARMRERSIAALVMKSGDAIAGLMSERDIVHAVSRHGERALSMAVLEVVAHDTITVAPDDTLKRAMILMTHHRVRHLPVIANGKLVGIVSIGDVVKHRLEDLETESNVLRDAYIAAH
jgi:CBS domain-containing protein